MSGPAHWQIAERFASSLIVQAVIPTAIVALAAAAACLGGVPPSGVKTIVVMLIALAAGIAALLLSAVLLFDALLFRVIASHDDEMEGTAAVDDMLFRMRLKPSPLRNRPLAERMAGTQRLLLRQWASLALFVVAAVIVAIASRP